MPCRHHSLRSREYGHCWEHEETLIEVVMFLTTLAFLIASAFYYSGLPPSVLQAGEVLWMAGSLIFFIVSCIEMYELCASHDEPLCVLPVFYEHLAYLVSTLIFMVGTILLWSGIYGGDAAKEEKGEVAACCFLIAGSFGFLVANIWNWLSFSFVAEASDEQTNSRWACLTRSALFCATLGSVCFILGSWLFSLDVEDGCDEYLPSTELTADQAKARLESGASASMTRAQHCS